MVPALAEVSQRGPQPLLGSVVQAAGRLVEEEDRRGAGQDHRRASSRRWPLGQVAGMPRRVEAARDPLQDRGGRPVGHVEVLVGGGALGGDGSRCTAGARAAGERGPRGRPGAWPAASRAGPSGPVGDSDGTCRGGELTGHGAEQGGLAGSVPAHQGGHRAGEQAQRQVLDDDPAGACDAGPSMRTAGRCDWSSPRAAVGTAAARRSRRALAHRRASRMESGVGDHSASAGQGNERGMDR